MMKDGVVTINGAKYVLWATEDDYRYGDMETAVHATPKKDFDEVMSEYKDADCYIFPFSIFLYDRKEFKEIVRSWVEDDME